MKKFFCCFSMIIVSAFFMFVVASKSVSAVYDTNNNQIGISVSKEKVEITVKYQRGFSLRESYYKWCKVSEGQEFDNVEISCTGEGGADANKFLQSIKDASPAERLALGDGSYVDSHPTTETFTVLKDNDILLSTNPEGGKYVLWTEVVFCSVRAGDAENGYTGCIHYAESKSAKVDVDFSVDDGKVNLGEIEDDEIKTMMEKISGIVYGTVLPIIWAAIGLFLVIKGTILGVQIVKAADEPQVRQEKIGALKWLVIGVGIAAAAAGAVQVITGFFSGVFK